jgi:hypothetical protein
MRFQKNYLFEVVIRFVTVVFLIGNSGFTAVIQHCSMQGVECCGERLSNTPCACGAGPVSGKLTLNTSDQCLATFTVGGLLNASAVLITPTLDFKKNILVSTDCAVALRPNLSSLHPGISVGDCTLPAPPSQAAKYLLHASLLI